MNTISLINGIRTAIATINTSAGTTSANKIPRTGSNGKLDISLLGVPRLYTELLTAGTNTISSLSFTPDYSYNVLLLVNGKGETVFNSAFSISGTSITWSAANAGYSIDSTFEIVARYTTNG